MSIPTVPVTATATASATGLVYNTKGFLSKTAQHLLTCKGILKILDKYKVPGSTLTSFTLEESQELENFLKNIGGDTSILTSTSTLSEKCSEILAIMKNNQTLDFQNLSTTFIGSMITAFSVILLLITCATYAVFWTLVARLLTDPAVIVAQSSYADGPGIASDDNTNIWAISVSMLFSEFVRNYLSLLGLPLGITIFSNIIDRARTSNAHRSHYTNYKIDKYVYIRLWILVALSSIISIVSFGLMFVNILLYSDGCGVASKCQKPYELIGLSCGVLVASILQVAIWMEAFRLFETLRSFKISFSKRWCTFCSK